MNRTAKAIVLSLATAALAACGGVEIGESCEEPGHIDECVEDAVCTNERDGDFCRALCFADTDCPGDSACNGVTGTSLKSCQPKYK